MAKVKYYAKENSTIGTHSFYAVPIPNGTLTFDELLEEEMDGMTVDLIDPALQDLAPLRKLTPDK